jgi:hypothetical protein
MATATVIFDQPPVVQGDRVTVSALVDGQRHTAECWLSHLNTLATKAAKQNYLAGLLKAAAYPPQGAAPDVSGTVTV